MSNVITKVTFENLAFNTNNKKDTPTKVLISTNIDDRYMISIKFGELECLLCKDDFKRIADSVL